MCAGALFAPSAFGQSRIRPARIGVLVVPPVTDYESRTNALRSGLRDLGYVDGANLQIDIRSAQGRFERLPLLAAELLQREVDVMVVAGTPVIRAVKQVTQTTPVVIAAVGDAVAGGHVQSLSRPGGNMTGSTYFAPELATKQLELLKELFPQEVRLALLFNPGNPAAMSTVQALDPSRRSLKLETQEFAVRDPSDFDAAFAAMAGNRFRMGLIVDDPITISNAKALADLSLQYRVAAGANFTEYADAGGLMAYGVNLDALWRRAAYFVDKILKGANPGDIPVERATKFDLVINRKTAAALQVNVVPSVLLRAERVIG